MARPRRGFQRKPEQVLVPIEDMLDQLATGLESQATEPNLYGYHPHDHQVTFHESTTAGRLFIGGNRSGKSVGGVVEDLWWVTKRHPYLELPEGPIRGRVVGSDFPNGVNTILLPIFKRWVIPSDLVNGSWEDSWSERGVEGEKTLHFANGSFLEFRSCDQELVKHAGTSRHFVHFDEEPPSSIFNENLLRLADTNGRFWITMTPIDGMTWVYEDLFMPATTGANLDVTVIQVSSYDNPHVTVEGLSKATAFLDEDEKKARLYGQFTPKGGLVYKDFTESAHVLEETPWVPPPGWRIYTSTDHGVNNPTAWLWHAVSPTGEVVTFHEHYASDMTISEHAQVVKQYEKDKPWTVWVRTGDPAMHQRNGESGMSVIQLYAKEGLGIGTKGVPHEVTIGVDRVRQYLKTNTRSGTPWWQVSRQCTNLIREMRALHWKTYESSKLADSNNPIERIQKKNDHACDALRYFFTLMPVLTPGDIVRQDASDQGYHAPTFMETIIQMSQPFAPMDRPVAWKTSKSWVDDDMGLEG
jgi:phage terminase large subunit-like protein